MDPSDPQALLDVAGLKHPCDLDLLLFFHRHPTAIMASEHLAAFAGYDLPQVARPLDLLVGAGILRRSANPTHIGRLYYFTTDTTNEWLPALIGSASTPDGRRELLRRLRPRSTTRETDRTFPRPGLRETKEGANHA